MKNSFRFIKIFFYLFAVIFLAYWCGTHEWVKFNKLYQQSVFSWLSLIFFSYLFLSHVFSLFQVLKPIETKNNTSEKDLEEHNSEEAL
jgi:hypothetical protein